MRRVFLLYCLSGFLSLGYQVAWFRVFVDHFGSTNLTFAFVLVNFIGGLGVGSFASRRFSAWLARRSGTHDPLRLYGLVEIAVAVSAVLTLLLPMVPADTWGTFPYHLDGGIHQPSAISRFAQLGISVLCVFVPCFFMGVTFPLLCHAFCPHARFPAALYAWNTLGACAGVLACEFVLLAWLGHQRMYLALVLVNGALGAYFLATGSRTAAASAVVVATPPVAAAASYRPSTLLLAAVISGGLTGAFEADVLRRLQFLDCRTGAALSCISMWAILGIFLASCTVRALPRLRLRHTQIAAVVALCFYLVVWHEAYPLRDLVNHADNLRAIAAMPKLPPGLSGSFQFFAFGYGFWPLLIFTGLFVLPPFYLVSLLLPQVCNAAQAAGRHLGLVYGANTLAFCVGMVAFTTLAPAVNLFYAMRLFLAVFALAVALLVALRPSGKGLSWQSSLAVVALFGLSMATPAGFAPDWFEPSSAAAVHPVRAMKSDGAHTTFVVGDPAGDLLFFDSHAMSGCNRTAQQYMRLMAHFPLLAHPDPGAALLICFGVGSTASAIAAHRSIEHLDIVDLDDQVFATANEFEQTNHKVAEDPRVRLVHDDGRHYLAVTDRSYDLITSEPPPPMFPGVARLYSVEYYTTARAHLTSGGMMTQWLPIDQMPRPAMRAAIASFVQVFPESLVFIGHGTNYILMGCKGSLRLANVEQRLAIEPRVAAELAQFGVERQEQLFARIVKCGPPLVAEFGGYPVVSDLRNDFSHLFHDPQAPPILTYDPVLMLQQVSRSGPDALACAAELKHIVMHLGRLATAVPDFPQAALMSVRSTDQAPVAMAGVDWNIVTCRVEAANRALGAHQFEDAEAQLAKVFEVAPEYPLVTLDLATLRTRLQRFEPALQAWRVLQAVEPKSFAAHYGVAYCLYRTGRRDEALSCVQEQLPNFRGVLALHRLEADLLADAGRWTEAVAAYERALQIDATDKASLDGRARCVERIRSGR